MAIMRKKEARELSPSVLDQKLDELSLELNAERGTVASGGKASNAGRIRELRRTIARILTIKREKAGAQPKEQKQAANEPRKLKEEKSKSRQRKRQSRLQNRKIRNRS
jgi:large subunit ribosomal protein L29